MDMDISFDLYKYRGKLSTLSLLIVALWVVFVINFILTKAKDKGILFIVHVTRRYVLKKKVENRHHEFIGYLYVQWVTPKKGNSECFKRET